MTALTILVTHKASGQSVGLVARELALDIGRATYTPKNELSFNELSWRIRSSSQSS